MPRYFFDINTGDGSVVDVEGSELPDRRAASRELIIAMVEIAGGCLPGKENRFLEGEVREEGGPVFFSTTLELSSTWT